MKHSGIKKAGVGELAMEGGGMCAAVGGGGMLGRATPMGAGVPLILGNARDVLRSGDIPVPIDAANPGLLPSPADGRPPRIGGTPAPMVEPSLIHHDEIAGETLSTHARDRMLAVRGEPMLFADWERTLMLHYEVAPEKLQPHVPFELDVRDGKAYVSAVAFTMRGMHPRRGGKLAALAFKPIATHGFLNVRTYVKHRGESGIYFLAEWLPNKLAVLLGRPVFGLPYRLGKLDYRHHHERGRVRGTVRSRNGKGVLRYRATLPDNPRFRPSDPGSLTEFLMERYTAFTTWMGWKRCFRVWHEPWPQCELDAVIEDDSLLALTGDWAKHARFIGANYSPGLRCVWMSRPNRVLNARTPTEP